MASVPPMVTSLADYTTADLEALERERPELGRVEIIDGALHATGESAVGIRHQMVVQHLFLVFAPLCPPHLLVMLDTWWHYARGKLRADLGIYRGSDVPEDGEVFRAPPLAVVEVLSDDAIHDLVAKDRIYAEHGTRRAYLDPHERHGWWARVDDVEHDALEVAWQLEGWPPVGLVRATLLAR